MAGQDASFFAAGTPIPGSTQLHGVPAAGTTGQVLSKLSAADYDTGWAAVTIAPNSITQVALGLDVFALSMIRTSLRF